MNLVNLFLNCAFLVLFSFLLFASITDGSHSSSDRRRVKDQRNYFRIHRLQQNSKDGAYRQAAAPNQKKVIGTTSGRHIHSRYEKGVPATHDWNVASSNDNKLKHGGTFSTDTESEFTPSADSRSFPSSKKLRALFDNMPQSDQGARLPLNDKVDVHKKDPDSHSIGSGLPMASIETEKILQFTANPQTVVLGETEVFTLTCSVNLPALARSSKGSVQPMSLEIGKHDGQTRRGLAVLSVIHGAIPIRDDLTSGARITGSVSKDATAAWTMSIIWSESILSALEGTYICKLTTMGPHMSVSDYAYTKLEVTVKDSPRVKLEERLATAEDQLDEMVRDGERRDSALRLVRVLLTNVTGVLVDTSNNSRLMRQKINKQAQAYVDLRKYLEFALESDSRLAEHINYTEQSIASTLVIQAQAMSQLRDQDRIFAAGLHLLDMRNKNVEQLISSTKERLNKELESQKRDVESAVKMMEGIEEHQEQTDKLLSDLGKQISHLNQMLNKTSESLHNLQAVLGLTEGSIRFNNNGAFGSEGRLEVFHSGQWGTVCDDNFDINAAQVVCKQLGYETNKATFYGKAHYGQGTGIPVHLDDISCSGQENKLVQCSHNVWGFTTCEHDED
ncbi:hypothetical protein Btru_021590, partial [Bulinus truncatus]